MRYWARWVLIGAFPDAARGDTLVREGGKVGMGRPDGVGRRMGGWGLG